MKLPRLSHQTQRFRRQLFAVMIIVCVCSCLLVCIFGSVLQSAFTYSLAPPQYPGSQFVLQENGGGSGGTIQTTIYRTTASVDVVRQFMEHHTPGFHAATTSPYRQSGERVSAYRNEVCNTNPIAEFVGHVLVSEPYPHCLTVTIYADQDQPSTTLIEIEARWPSG